MLSFFRRLINSKAGVIVTFVVLGVIALAFAAGDVTGLRTSGMGGLSGNNVAKVGGSAISVAELKSRVGNAMDAIRQQQPTLTADQFVAQGGLDGVLNQLINGLALDEFGHDQGMVVSKRLVDGQIAGIPGLSGPTGKFDPAIYQQLLSQRRLTDRQVRADIARDLITQQLIGPTIGAAQVPLELAKPYAALLLEKRTGTIGFVPAAAMPAGAAPSDAELQAFYRREIARYTLPERRVLRYALVTPAQVAGKATPTDAEIAQAYNRDRAKYAPSEKRTVSRVVVLDQASAAALAAKVKSGTSIADAARAAGLEPQVQAGVDKAAFAAATSPAAADAVFAAPKGAVVGPVRGGLGWIVAQVDSITQDPGKTLAQARPAIVEALTKQKTLAALGAIHDAIDDGLASNATFDEAIADQHLSAQSTAALTAAGIDPSVAGAKPDPALAPIVSAGFQMQEGDAPQMVPVGQDGSFALVGVGRVVAAAPRPLTEVRAEVARDYAADRQRVAARQVAGQVLAQVNKGTPLAQALAASGRPLPAPKPASATRAQLAANPQDAPPPLVLMFSMPQGAAKLLEAPGGAGWYVVKLDQIQPGNIAASPGVVGAARADIARLVGREYAEQFSRAVRNAVGVKTDPSAIARVRADLTGAGGAN